MSQPGQVAVVTGAGGALGSAVAGALAADGWTVMGVDRDEQALLALPAEVHREAANVMDPQDVDALFDRVTSAQGQVRAVVNTVGGFRVGAAVETPPEDFRLMLDLNLGAAWWVSRAAGQRMSAAGGGAIVNVVGRHGVDVLTGAAAYSVSKGGLVHLTRVLDAELRASGVRVNAVVPGLIDTPANRAAMSAAEMKNAVAPEAIARVVAFLVADAAAPVVGAVVPVYGAG